MADRSQPQHPQHSPAQITGFRIMRRTEVAPGWWAQPTEVGETGSATVADSFCREQNAVTMDANRTKRIEYYADPIYADGTEPLPPAAEAALARLELRLNYPTDLYRALTRHQDASQRTAQLSAWMDRRDLTAVEFGSFEWAQDVMRETRGELAAAGRTDLIGAAR
mgnify:CR=1 FL=1